MLITKQLLFKEKCCQLNKSIKNKNKTKIFKMYIVNLIIEKNLLEFL